MMSRSSTGGFPWRGTNCSRDREDCSCYRKGLRMMNCTSVSKRFTISRIRSRAFARTSNRSKKSKISFTRRSPKEASNWLKCAQTMSTPWFSPMFKLWKAPGPALAPSSSCSSTLIYRSASKTITSSNRNNTSNPWLPKSKKLTTQDCKKSAKKSLSCRHCTKNTLKRSVC